MLDDPLAPVDVLGDLNAVAPDAARTRRMNTLRRA